ncbi:MAG TPA: MerR family transcriptional regulator [Trebonia sp.]|nr:MerR family transcriptional regulator [Trebonia sp.]
MTGGHQPALASGTPGRGSASRGSVSIGQVLDALSSEFPDVSPSKIRFLEAEGLIQPLRSSSGYRRFSVADIERLRFILTAQRDEYLPLRVIKERLDAVDGTADGGAVPAVAMTRSELLAAAGAAEDLLAELEDYGLIRRARSYGTQALSVLRSAVKLGEHGIQPRHLRVVKAAVERESALIEQAVAPLTRQKGSREPALRAAQDIAGHIASLHATLIEDGLSEAGLASQPPHPGTQSGESREAPGLRSASGR